MTFTRTAEQIQKGNPFSFIASLVFNKSRRIIDTKDSDEKAITVRVPQEIAERLDNYATACRISRTLLIKQLLEISLDEVDEAVVEEEERQQAEGQVWDAIEELQKQKKERLSRAKAILAEKNK